MKLRLLALAFALVATPLAAQYNLSGPPDGGNQRASVMQGIGPVEVEITYSSPDVHAPDGSDRRGRIWGELVPWGWADLGFGTCGAHCPWRGGANENTVFRVSHDVEVEGRPLPAGRYGLHFLPGPERWTVIFSRDADAWGSFFYEEAHDALRVEVTPVPHSYREYLTYEFPERGDDGATLELQWEELAVPIRVVVPGLDEIYYRQMAAELSNSRGFDWHAWVQGTRFLLRRGIHPDVAEKWAELGVGEPYVGEENFTTLTTLSEAQRANGREAAAKITLERALDHRLTSPVEVYQYVRPLLGEGRAAEALAALERVSGRLGGAWPLEVGLGRAHAGLGHGDEALAHLRRALEQAPDAPNRANLERLIARVEAGDLAIN